MKKANLVVRIALGALYLFASVSFFLNLAPQPQLSGNMLTFMSGLMASQYMFPLVKAVELLCGIALVSGFFLPLAIVAIFPISLNIFLIHVFLAPADLPIAIFIIAANLYLAYAYRGCYKGLFSTKCDCGSEC